MPRIADPFTQSIYNRMVMAGLTCDLADCNTVPEYIKECKEKKAKTGNLVEECLCAARAELPKLELNTNIQEGIMEKIRLADASQLEYFLSRYRKTLYKVKVFKSFINNEL